jgi:hypothetical protein
LACVPEMIRFKIKGRNEERSGIACHLKKKRGGRSRNIGAVITHAITPICHQKGFVEARILLEWDYIVTSQFSQFCIPLKVTFPLKKRSEGRLFLQATSSMATEIAYLEPLILSRVNQYFGYQAISKITIFQGPVTVGGTARNPHRIIPKKPLPEATQASLETRVQPIEDERLRSALLSLGVSISGEQQKT